MSCFPWPSRNTDTEKEENGMSKKQMIRRRGLSAFLAMAMCFGLLPATAWAAEEGVAIDESNFPNKTFRNYI